MNTTLDTVATYIKNNDSGLNYYKNALKKIRIAQNSLPCNENQSGSCKGYYRQFDKTDFQTFDTERRTGYTPSQYEQCIKRCKRLHPYNIAKCTNKCETQQRFDFV